MNVDDLGEIAAELADAMSVLQIVDSYDLYGLLDFPGDATMAELLKAYCAQAFGCHPDKLGSLEPEARQGREDQLLFQMISQSSNDLKVLSL